MIRLDCTPVSVVIVCTDCGPAWTGFAFTKMEGWERGAAHEKRTHPGQTQAQDALSEARRKAAQHAV
ncbi:hypothetical protein [Microbacterium xylanilyticum]